ncbi:MAG: exosortase-associated protein EpsI, B-type [Pseudomonadota bacterium]
MTATRIRALIVFAAMVTTAALAHWATPSTHLSDVLGKPDLEKIFPAEFAGWRIDARAGMVLPSPQTQAILDSIYNQTLSRTYINPAGERVMLSVAYGGDQSDATRAHLPEVCYPAQGFQITANAIGQLDLAGRSVSTRLLMSKLGQRNEPITYWLIVGDRVTLSRVDQKLTQFRLGLKGLIPDGMLVRVSSIDSDMSRGHRVQAQFLADMATAFSETSRDRVFGTLSAAR